MRSPIVFGGAAAASNRHLARRAIHRSAFVLNHKMELNCTEDNQAKIYDFLLMKKLVDEKLHHAADSTIIVDVREPSELAELGKIPTSINIPIKSSPGALGLSEEEFENLFRTQKPALDKELVFYCRSGIRCTAAEQLAASLGYKHRGNYVGSFSDWVANKGTVEPVKAESSKSEAEKK